MADQHEVEQALLDAIKTQAEIIERSTSGSYAANHAAAAARLAEALAWLRDPSQPHGGNATAS